MGWGGFAPPPPHHGSVVFGRRRLGEKAGESAQLLGCLGAEAQGLTGGPGPEDGRFIPPDLPGPDLINVRPMGGLIDMDFNGEPLFQPYTAGGR